MPKNMPREHVFSFNIIFKNIDGDKLHNVFSLKTIFSQKATIDNKLKCILNRMKMII